MDPGAAILALLFTVIGFLVLYSVIRTAVKAALEQHYRVVRWYEATGEWYGSKPDPRQLPDPVLEKADDV
jgi:hypothetical protein